MAPTTLLELKGKNDALVMNARDWAVLAHVWEPGCPYMPANLTDASGILQDLPTGWNQIGEIQKAAGVNITPDTQTSPIEGYGSSNPRRTLVTSETFAIDFYAQEWRKQNLSMWHNTDLSSVNATPGQGFKARKTSQLGLQYYSILLLGLDGTPGNEIYIWFEFGKTAVTQRQAMAGQQNAELGMPLTLNVFEDSEWGALYDFGVAGPGFDDIAVDAGFLSAATSITVHPSTADLLADELLQLTVIDNNGQNRTAECTFESATPAAATVSTSGLVTGVATGSAVITATLDALTDTCTVTLA